MLLANVGLRGEGWDGVSGLCGITDDRWLDFRDQNQKRKFEEGRIWKNVNIKIWNLKIKSSSSLFFFFLSPPFFSSIAPLEKPTTSWQCLLIPLLIHLQFSCLYVVATKSWGCSSPIQMKTLKFSNTLQGLQTLIIYFSWFVVLCVL